MKYTVVIDQVAHNDIKRNAEWWAENHSYEQAFQWKTAIYEQLRDLADMPTRHGMAPENSQLSIEIRQMLVGLGKRRTYRAVFTMNDSFVHVLTVRRASQDTIRSHEIP